MTDDFPTFGWQADHVTAPELPCEHQVVFRDVTGGESKPLTAQEFAARVNARLEELKYELRLAKALQNTYRLALACYALPVNWDAAGRVWQPDSPGHRLAQTARELGETMAQVLEPNHVP